MTKMLLHTLVITLYFLALINPISKVSVLAVFSSAHEHKDFMHVAMSVGQVQSTGRHCSIDWACCYDNRNANGTRWPCDMAC